MRGGGANFMLTASSVHILVFSMFCFEGCLPTLSGSYSTGQGSKVEARGRTYKVVEGSEAEELDVQLGDSVVFFGRLFFVRWLVSHHSPVT